MGGGVKGPGKYPCGTQKEVPRETWFLHFPLKYVTAQNNSISRPPETFSGFSIHFAKSSRGSRKVLMQPRASETFCNIGGLCFVNIFHIMKIWHYIFLYVYFGDIFCTSKVNVIFFWTFMLYLETILTALRGNLRITKSHF